MTWQLADEPRWVEANGIAASGEGWRVAVGERGVALGHDGMRVIALAGIAADVGAAALAPIVAAHTDHALLFSVELAPVIAQLGRRPQRAIIHTLSDASTLPDGAGATILADDARLDHVPAPLADELAIARQLGLATIAAAALIRAERVDGREPVWGTDADNLSSLALARRLGFGAIDELGVAAAAR